ncbi:MAG TPA: Rid family detoxifying hydrolase [bacterium]|nr:Rid family detoxifying hydrolase [bacterium]
MGTNIKIGKLPKAFGPYSVVSAVDNLLFVSGQFPVDIETNQMIEPDIEKQTHCILTNIKNFIYDNGLNMKSVVKTTVYLKNIDDFPKMNDIYSNYFEIPYPARAVIEASRLPKDSLIEIECVIKK